MVIFTLLFIWRFGCPSYLIYNSRQYIIGNEYKGLYKSFSAFINFIEFSNIVFSSLFLYYSTQQIESIKYLLSISAKYLYENSPVFKEYFLSLYDKLGEDVFSEIKYLAMLYMLLVFAYHAFYFYFNRVVVERKRTENIKSTKTKRLSNLYQRKAHILNGENLD